MKEQGCLRIGILHISATTHSVYSFDSEKTLGMFMAPLAVRVYVIQFGLAV